MATKNSEPAPEPVVEAPEPAAVTEIETVEEVEDFSAQGNVDVYARKPKVEKTKADNGTVIENYL
ncbi:hypothetical protein [Novosphingobium meiothermophilum]|uniref:hypothetical protein n=1 Tax=Novosphingobium meiothermophilum TaxID=2202251 RepID=UPI000D6DC80B|nr:hypothetical protein [Novosphingobium meiothermophilum]